MITYGDVRQLAGLLEGEGHFGFQRVHHTPIVCVGMTDLDVIERARGWLHYTGKIHVYTPKRVTEKPVFRLQLHGADAAAWMMILFQFMGSRRRGQILAALEGWKRARLSHKLRTACPAGHPYDFSGVTKSGRTFRGCRRCEAASTKRYRDRLRLVV